MKTRYFALVIGAIYVIVGILGFVPAALSSPPADAPSVSVTSNYGYLLGIFPVNLLHDLVHIAVGALGLWAYTRYGAARAYSQGLAVVFGLLTVMGFFPGLKTTFGLIPLFGNDIWLHALTALVAAYFGFVARPALVAQRR